MNKRVTESYLRNTPLPVYEGGSYCVISHGSIIDKSREELTNKNYIILKEEYAATSSGDVATGKYFLESTKDPEMQMVFSWINSYNKQVKFSCAVGGFIYDSETAFVGSEGASWIRRHTGDALKEAMSVIEDMVAHAEKHFDKIIADKNCMKNVPCSDYEHGKLMGTLYFEKDVFTINESTFLKSERKRPTQNFTDSENFWGVYKTILFAISESSLQKVHINQQKIHAVIMTDYLDGRCVDVPFTLEDSDALGEEDSAALTEKYSEEETIIEVQHKEVAKVNLPLGKQINLAPDSDTSEKQVATCDHCGSEDVIFNSSAQILCNNCGHEEDTSIEEEEVGNDYPLEVEEEIAVCPSPVEIHIESDEEYAARVVEIEGEPEPIEEVLVGDTTELLLNELENTVEEVEEINDEEEFTLFDAEDESLEENIIFEEEKLEVVPGISTASITIDEETLSDTSASAITVDILDLEERVPLIQPSVNQLTLKEMKLIEERMMAYYGKISSYTFEHRDKQINITIDETQECFFL